MVKRLLSGIFLVGLLVAAVLAGSPAVLLLCAAISLLGMFEYYRVLGLEKTAPGRLSMGLMLLYYVALGLGWQNPEGAVPVIFLMHLMAWYVLRYPRYHLRDISPLFLGTIYPGVMMTCLWRIRSLEQGVYLVWLAVISAWGCDTLAYCAGMLFGRHKLAPVLSPKKTIEGAVGGTLGAGLLGMLFGRFAGNMMGVEDFALISGASCLAGALIAQLGDLAASAIKRDYRVKDYGRLIPGHGGVLDRFDSLIFTAPAVYGALLLFLGK